MPKNYLTYDHNPIVQFGDDVTSCYLESKNNLTSLPSSTLLEESLEPSMPNIFSVPQASPSEIWKVNTSPTPLYVKATKADIGGVGGHVEVSRRVKAEVLDYILRHNRYGKGKPIFRSLIATHTGDDICITLVIDQQVFENQSTVDSLLWDAFQHGSKKAYEEGLYGPGQDLKADAFTGNIRGLGPASVVLPLPFEKEIVLKNPSQTVLLATADKTDPGAYNYLTTGAYLDPMFNTGLLIAESAMRRGFIFDIYDLDTKAQAIEQGASPTRQAQLDRAMDKLGKTERVIRLSGPEDYYDIAALTMNSLRFVVARIYTKDDRGGPKTLGVVVSAERLHNIKTSKGFTYGGKDDPLMLALCQGDWPAPGEIVSPLAKTPLVPGDCRGSHYLHLSPMPINEQTSYFSGPIISVITLSINRLTGHIGAISDQLARGTPWDEYRAQAATKMEQFRSSQGYRQPGTLHTDEMEYQPGFKLRVAKLEKKFVRREVK